MVGPIFTEPTGGGVKFSGNEFLSFVFINDANDAAQKGFYYAKKQTSHRWRMALR
jgi:hypothetical protein